MGLRERFYDILTSGDLTAAGDFDEGVVLAVALEELLEAVCENGDHDWPIEINDDPFLRHFDDPPRREITGPCRICGVEYDPWFGKQSSVKKTEMK